MSKTILKAELKRLREFEKILDKGCPVCIASFKLVPTYKPTNCSLRLDIMTACSPSVQKRCKKIMRIEEKLEYTVLTAIDDIQKELRELE